MNISTEERFLRRTMPEPNSGCLIWTASCKRLGYGQFKLNGKMEPAHRISYKLFRGKIGKLNVLHKCDVRCCVEPSHLFLGTQIDNIADMDAKGRRKSFLVNLKKTHCKKGHPFDRPGERGKSRRCVTCNRASALARYYRAKGVKLE